MIPIAQETPCRYQHYRFDETAGAQPPILMCRQQNAACIAQRYCKPAGRWLLSERVRQICRLYEPWN